MRYILLVGLREFAENVKTKGFWLGILVVPILITASVAANPPATRKPRRRSWCAVIANAAA